MRWINGWLALSGEEQRAARLLSRIHGHPVDKVHAACIPRDHGGAEGLHDFDLLVNDERIAVEVTSMTSNVDAAFQVELERLTDRMNGDPRRPDWMGRYWCVWVNVPGGRESDAADHQAKRDAVKALEANTSALCAELHTGHDATVPIQVFGRKHGGLRDLGIAEVTGSPVPSGGSRVQFHPRPTGGWFSGDGLQQGVSEKLSNHKKQRQAADAKTEGADSVHLFIWVPISQQHDGGAGIALRLGDADLVGEVPDLGNFDAVWLATDGWAADEDIGYPADVWHADRGDGEWTRWRLTWQATSVAKQEE